MEKDEFIEDLGIEGGQSFNDDGDLVVTLNETTWQKAQVILENSDDLEEDEESSSMNYDSSNIQYTNDYFILNLIADFNANEFKLVAKDR